MKLTAYLIVAALLAPAAVSGQAPADPARDFTNAILWQQHSGEYRALAFQAYNSARFSLDCALKKHKRKLAPGCVVVDIDETVLDNSLFQGNELKKGVSFLSEDWKEWTAKASADTVPGALSFLQYAASKKVEVFYVTNRDTSELEGTLQNLKKFNFPFADRAHLLARKNTSDKEGRRLEIERTHSILLICGDNLNDFSDIFYLKGRDIKATVNEMQPLFGTRFIILPNPMYGDWEQKFYAPDRNLSETEKAARRFNAIRIN